MKQIKICETQPIRPLGDLFGLFFEDLNHAADGGMYAELIQNRSFEFCPVDNEKYDGLTAWQKGGALDWEIRTSEPLNEKNTHYLHVAAQTGAYVENKGFNTGIYMKAGEKYRFSVYARCLSDEAAHTWSVSVTDMQDEAENQSLCARTLVRIQGGLWKKYEAEVTADKTTTCGRLRVCFGEEGTYDLDMVSLFPEDTFRGRKNGMRKDIAQALCEMKPKFLRFPGGCLTHDGSLDSDARNSMYRWKNTVGPVEKRPARRNNWGYNQTLGIGYYEYFLFCEDIGAKPLPVLPGGFNPHKGEGVPLSGIGEWVQETLDLIEFANGGTDTKWGAVRAQMGHEEPFGLEYLAIGNEEIGDGFFERYPYFHHAVREKYPEIKLINSAGPFAVGEGYDAGWTSAKQYGSDLIDEHYYSSPEWFLANMHHYEDYDENGPKVFLGEYASWDNTYYNALVEAAYMTHLERSKAVGLACYAPMLCNADYVNWKPDMLWFDNHRILKTPNYYVQKLFMEYQGTDTVRFETEGLDEVCPLIERDRIDGALTIQGNDVAGDIWNIRITDGQTGEVTRCADFAVTQGEAEHILAQTDACSYMLEFSFRRREGRKGLKISFGRKDEKNYLQWEFGGWDNWDCNLVSAENGRASTISHRIFHVDDREYTLRLEVNGKQIRTYVNGELYNDTVYRLPELEELYVTAGIDRESGQTILKAVNLTGEAKTTLISLEGVQKKAVVTELKGHALTEENTFDEPDRIVPVSREIAVGGKEMEYEFAPHSMTVIVFG